MIKLNLKTNGIEQEKLKEYLENNASEILTEKINNGVRIVKDNKTLINKKDLKGFWKYATDEAKKIAEKSASGTFVDDNTVYGWLVHYFEEDTIEGTLFNEDGTEYKPALQTFTKVENNTKNTIKTTPKIENSQPTLFDLFNNKQEKTEIENELIEDQEIEEDDEISEEEIQEVIENESKTETRIIDYETGEIIETKEEIKTFDIEIAKMLYSMLDGKLSMK